MISKHNNVDVSDNTCVSLSDCFEQVASLKTLVMYKANEKLTITRITEVKMSV